MSRGLLESCTVHGKLWLDEMDQPTHLGFVAEPALTYTREDAVALLRRNVLHPLLRGHGLWYYDFGPRFSAGWWDDPVLIAEVGRLKALADARQERNYDSPEDVLLVCDTAVFHHTAPGFEADPVSEAALDRCAAALYRSGAIFHMVGLGDLERVSWPRYRAVVFANTWLLSGAQRSFLREEVARGGRHLVFVYAPGYSDGGSLSADRVSEVAGMAIVSRESQSGVRPFFAVAHPDSRVEEGAPGAVRRDHAGWTSWYCSLPPTDPAVLRHIFRSAGVHVWSDSGDVLIAGWGLLCVHTLEGGERSITLPGGRRLVLQLPQRCTVLLDTESGDVLIPPEPLNPA